MNDGTANDGNPRVYIHEFVDIHGHRRGDYMQHMTANWGPIGRAERNQLCFGVWAVVGSTGQWPQVVNLWEYENWGALGANFEVELTGGGLQDPSLESWWADAAEMRRGGRDRILVGLDWSPSVASLASEDRDAPPAGYLHEVISTRPGTVDEYLDRVRDGGSEVYRRSGFRLVGAFKRAMANEDECILIWSFATWGQWSVAMAAATSGDGIGAFHSACRNVVLTADRILLADAPLSPTRTGRQPQESDRTPLR